MQIYNVYQSGKRLYIDEKENPDNKIVVNKYDNMQQTLRLISDGTLPPRLYWALRNPKLSNKYFILKLVNNEDLIVGTDISAYVGLWDMLLIGTDEDYIIEGADIDQSRLTYVSDHFGRLFVRDNFLEELDFEEQCSPTFKIFYNEIMFQLGEKADAKDIPDKMSDLENDTNFISGVALKDDGNGHVEIIGTTFSGGETEEGEIPSGGNVEVDDKLDEESTNPVQNKVVAKEINSLKQKDESLDKEVIALRERNAELEETIEKLQIKTTTDPSPFHHITDSANMKVVDFGMEGKTEQRTTSGKNLFDIADFKAVTSFTPLSVSYVGYKLNTVAGQTYTFNRNTSDGYNVEGLNTACIMSKDGTNLAGLIDKWTASNNKASATFTADEEAYLVFTAGITASKIQELFDTYFINPQLELGSVATDYEPFTNGPSPNPDYQQEIKNAGVYNEETGRYEHKCCVGNKNLFDLAKAQDGSNYVWGAIYPYFPIHVGKGNVVAFSCDLSSVDGFTDNSIIFDSIDGNVLSYIYHSVGSQLNKESGKITSPNDYIYMRINNPDSTGYLKWVDYIKDIQIELLQPSDYTPHASQPFTLTSPVPLTKWDNLVKRDGVWGWSVNHWHLTFDGSENWSLYSNKNGFLLANALPESMNYREGLCNQLLRNSPTDTNYMYLGTNSTILFAVQVRLYDDLLEDKGLANWKAHLNEHPLEIWTYSDTEQAFIPLPEEEQTLLNNLETYYGVTNVYNEQGCPMWLTYVNDTKLYTNQQIAKQIAQTQALILES